MEDEINEEFFASHQEEIKMEDKINEEKPPYFKHVTNSMVANIINDDVDRAFMTDRLLLEIAFQLKRMEEMLKKIIDK